MNTNFNLRFQSTEEKIQKALFSLLKFKKYNDISIKEICYEAGINRSSFYAHYQDINDLMIKTETNLSKQISKIFNPDTFWGAEVFTSLFEFLLKNKDFYKSYLQTNEQSFMEKNDFMQYFNNLPKASIAYSSSDMIYHMAFFAGGIKALAKSWIMRGCKETPEQMSKILKDEYTKTKNSI